MSDVVGEHHVHPGLRAAAARQRLARFAQHVVVVLEAAVARRLADAQEIVGEIVADGLVRAAAQRLALRGALLQHRHQRLGAAEDFLARGDRRGFLGVVVCSIRFPGLLSFGSARPRARRRIGAHDHLLQLLAGLRRIDDQADLVGVGLELRVAEGVGQRLAHGGDAIRRHVRRQQQRPAQRLRRGRRLHQELVVLVGEEVGRERHVRQFLQPLRPVLHDRLGLLLLQPGRAASRSAPSRTRSDSRRARRAPSRGRRRSGRDSR